MSAFPNLPKATTLNLYFYLYWAAPHPYSGGLFPLGPTFWPSHSPAFPQCGPSYALLMLAFLLLFFLGFLPRNLKVPPLSPRSAIGYWQLYQSEPTGGILLLTYVWDTTNRFLG